jgi:hypothetical protein
MAGGPLVFMSDWSNQVKAAFREARKAFGVSFTVAGDSNTYKGVMLSGEELLPLMPGGFPEDYSKGLQFDQGEVTLAIGGLVTIGGIVYRIGRFSDSSDEDPIKVAMLTGKDK